MGPIIVAIDAGHFEKTVNAGNSAKKVCRKCGTEWECAAIKRAKVEQVAYAADLARRARREKDKTRVPKYNKGLTLG